MPAAASRLAVLLPQGCCSGCSERAAGREGQNQNKATPKKMQSFEFRALRGAKPLLPGFAKLLCREGAFTGHGPPCPVPGRQVSWLIPPDVPKTRDGNGVHGNPLHCLSRAISASSSWGINKTLSFVSGKLRPLSLLLSWMLSLCSQGNRHRLPKASEEEFGLNLEKCFADSLRETSGA